MPLQDNVQSDNLNELFSALGRAQAVLENAKKDSKNPFFKSNYADLSSVLKTCREVLSNHGLSVIQTLHRDSGELCLMTTLGHSSGQWVRSFYPISYSPNAKDINQAIGSAITYGRRYALAAIVGISQEDTDGEDAGFKHDNRKFHKEEPKIVQHEEIKVSSDQVSILSSLLNDRPALKEFIMKSAGITAIKDFPAVRFDKAIAYIKNDIKTKEDQELAVAQ